MRVVNEIQTNLESDNRNIAQMLSTTSDADQATYGTVFMPYYRVEKWNKLTVGHFWARIDVNNSFLIQSVTQWENTDALTQIYISASGAFVNNFVSGTIIEVYGQSDTEVITSGTFGDLHIFNGHLIP